MTKRIAIILTGCLALAILGCHGSRLAYYSDDGDYLPPKTGPGLVPADKSPIPDLPVPIGFVAVPSRCHVEATAASRSVIHFYQGRATMADAVAFYRLQPPRYGWRFIREQSDDHSLLLRFEKRLESLTIQLTRASGVVSVNLVIADQFAQMPPPATAQP